MVTTVRLDRESEGNLINLSKTLNKKKSEVIREAIYYYALMIEKERNKKIKKAVLKTKNVDKKVFEEYEDILDDAL